MYLSYTQKTQCNATLWGPIYFEKTEMCLEHTHRVRVYNLNEQSLRRH